MELEYIDVLVAGLCGVIGVIVYGNIKYFIKNMIDKKE